MWKLLFKLYLVILHLLILFTLYYGYSYLSIFNSSSFLEQRQNTVFYDSMLSYLKRVDNNNNQNSTIFIGDSIVQGLCTSCIVEKSINFGIGGDTTKGVLQRIKHYKSLNNSQNIVLSIGINDLYRKKINREIINNYKKILDYLSHKKAKLIVMGIFPIVDLPHLEDNKIINELNVVIKKLCESYNQCHFMNLTSKLVDSTGNLKKEYHIGDGIHLNNKSYFIWQDNLKKILK